MGIQSTVASPPVFSPRPKSCPTPLTLPGRVPALWKLLQVKCSSEDLSSQELPAGNQMVLWGLSGYSNDLCWYPSHVTAVWVFSDSLSQQKEGASGNHPDLQGLLLESDKPPSLLEIRGFLTGQRYSTQRIVFVWPLGITIERLKIPILVDQWAGALMALVKVHGDKQPRTMRDCPVVQLEWSRRKSIKELWCFHTFPEFWCLLYPVPISRPAGTTN